MPGSIEAEFFERPEMPKQSLLVQMPLLGLFGIGLGGFFSHSPIMTAIVILLAILMIIGLFKIVKSFFKILIIIGIIVILIYFLTNIR
ncbi:hypothetical protein C4546_00530 [Candidatus Parcubacteria bacterium]|nr:MAG: hypothetical protein C4546_00530 [Candidatus Parcubacteria bacterium]